MNIKVYVKELYYCYDCPNYNQNFERCGLTGKTISKAESKRFVDPTCQLPDMVGVDDDIDEVQ